MTDNVFDAARTVIKEQGWCQGSLRNRAGNVCIFGALATAKTGDITELVDVSHDGAPIRTLLAQVIGEQYPEAIRDRFGLAVPHWWNDEEGRTVADVDLILDKAARIHDERAS